MFRFSTCVVSVLSLLTVAEAAIAQSRGVSREEFMRMLQARSSRRSSSTQPTAAAAQQRSSSPREVKRPTGPQVTVEVLFLEITSTNKAKKPIPTLSGDAGAVRKALAEMKKNGQLKTESRIKLSAMDGQKAMSQTGGQTYIVRSIAAGGGRGGFPGGRTSRSYSSRSYGTMVSITPTVEDNGSVVLQTQFEKSWPQGGGDAGAEAGESVPPTTITQTTISSTTRLASGQFAILSSSSKASKNGVDRSVVLASATIDIAPVAKTEVRVIPLKTADAKQVANVVEQLLNDKKTTIVPDARSNSVIVKGPKMSLQMIEALIEKLDREK